MTNNNKQPTSKDILGRSLAMAKKAHLTPSTELLEKPVSPANVFKLQEPPMNVLRDTAPRLSMKSTSTIMKVVNSDMGELDSKVIQIREPVSMLSAFDSRTFMKYRSKCPDMVFPFQPCITSEANVTMDNINATIAALGLLYFKTFPSKVDIVLGFYGVGQAPATEPVGDFHNGRYIYVRETRFRHNSVTDRTPYLHDSAWMNDERIQLNRYYPVSLLEEINERVQTRYEEEARMSGKTLATMRERVVVMASVLIALRARGIWVAEQYYKKYKTPLEISYQGVMKALHDPKMRIDTALNLDI